MAKLNYSTTERERLNAQLAAHAQAIAELVEQLGLVSGGGGFIYTVTGAEADPLNLVIALPSARSSANYAVFVTQQQFTYLLGMGVLAASRTLTQFTLSLSAAATVGDVFSFLVASL